MQQPSRSVRLDAVLALFAGALLASLGCDAGIGDYAVDGKVGDHPTLDLVFVPSLDCGEWCETEDDGPSLQVQQLDFADRVFNDQQVTWKTPEWP